MDDITFNPGGIPDAHDDRDYQLEDVIGMALPPFDWKQGYDVEEELQTKLHNLAFHIPVKDQGQSGSCGGQAWGYYGEVLEALQTGSFEERSAKFLYAQTFVPGGGSSGKANCIVAHKQGWGKEALTRSYDHVNPPTEAFMDRPQDITDAARSDAKAAKALVYAAPNYIDIDSIASATKLIHGTIIGIAGCNNGTWLSQTPAPPTRDKSWWYHWLYVGGALRINGKKYLLVLNSWGKDVGTNGWQHISEDYVNTPGAITNVWTIVYDNTVLPQTFTHNFTVPLHKGQTNVEVTALQTALKILGYFTVPVTGYYGALTAKAVLAFQVAQGISPTSDINVGPQTNAALNGFFNK